MTSESSAKIVGILRRYEDDPENMDANTRREVEDIVDFDVFESYCGSDMPIDTVAKILVGFRAASSRKLNDAELRSLIESFHEIKESEAQSVLDVITFNANCRHSAKSDLIFYPESVFGKPKPTTDEVLQKALRGE